MLLLKYLVLSVVIFFPSFVVSANEFALSPGQYFCEVKQDEGFSDLAYELNIETIKISKEGVRQIFRWTPLGELKEGQSHQEYSFTILNKRNSKNGFIPLRSESAASIIDFFRQFESPVLRAEEDPINLYFKNLESKKTQIGVEVSVPRGDRLNKVLAECILTEENLAINSIIFGTYRPIKSELKKFWNRQGNGRTEEQAILLPSDTIWKIVNILLHPEAREGRTLKAAYQRIFREKDSEDHEEESQQPRKKCKFQI